MIPTDRERQVLAPYAMFSDESAGRTFEEPPHSYRSPFQRDRDRIVHSSAFRRLAHKTQVFTGELGDYHRSRLTHTLEVASIARTIGRPLGLNEDLIEALALMHDIGHPPFGHAGEDVLNECVQNSGGFDHNSHAVRIVTVLEQRYPEFPGLNLTGEVLSGQKTRQKQPADEGAQRGRLLEVQVVDAADSIAYDSHDADDALELELLALEDLLAVPLWREAAARAQQRYASLDASALRRATIHQLIETLVSDLVETTRSRLATLEIDSAQQAAAAVERVVAPSRDFQEQKATLEAFLFERVYRHPTVLQQRTAAGDALRTMFNRYQEQRAPLPPRYRQVAVRDGLARAICDYLAGMTDRYAWESYRQTRY